MDNKVYTINEACDLIGAQKYAVRRIIRNGLIRGIKRQKNHYRLLNSQQVELLKTLCFLHRSGVNMKELKRYAAWEYDDGKTLDEQKAFLETKRRQFWENLKDLQEVIDHIERKIEVIDQK